ncbi:MAG: M28 family peptidase [Balneolales bacterium]
MRAFHTSLIFCFSALSCYAQNQAVSTSADVDLNSFQELITADYLRNHLEVIAHDSLLGRGTGEDGLKKAANYLADYHEKIGLTPIGDDGSYFQHFNLNSRTLKNITFRTSVINNSDTTLINESIYQHGEAAPYTRLTGADQPLKGDIVFAGFGVVDAARNIDNLRSKDMSGKWVMVFEDIPNIVDGDTLVDPDFDNSTRLNEILMTRNAAGLIVIPSMDEDEYTQASKISSLQLGTPLSLSLNNIPATQSFSRAYLSVSPEFAAGILDIRGGADELMSLKNDMIDDLRNFQSYKTTAYLETEPEIDEDPIETQNVVSYFEGGDPDLKDEVVVLMAHYDHLGTNIPDETGDYVFNGADDNGSGTVSMLNIARSLTKAAEFGIRPRRSILFLHVSAEEWGLLGSRYYSENPIIPIGQTVANINMDMIGRRDQHHIGRDEEDFVYIIGAEIISSDMDSLLQEGNRKSANIDLNMRYNDLDDPNQFYRRSDHWNFGRLEIPFIFFFSGVHEDYHRRSDTVDKILFGALEKRARVIYATTIEIANANERPEVDSEEFIRRTRN